MTARRHQYLLRMITPELDAHNAEIKEWLATSVGLASARLMGWFPGWNQGRHILNRHIREDELLVTLIRRVLIRFQP